MSLQFELVSPEKLLVSKPVAMVTVPGGEGDYGVLAGHAPLITTLSPGVIDIYADSENTVTERIFVAGGFAETNATRCTVLAEEATPVAQLDRAKLEAEAQKLAEQAASAAEGDRDAVEAQLAIVQAKLAAAA